MKSQTHPVLSTTYVVQKDGSIFRKDWIYRRSRLHSEESFEATSLVVPPSSSVEVTPNRKLTLSSSLNGHA